MERGLRRGDLLLTCGGPLSGGRGTGRPLRRLWAGGGRLRVFSSIWVGRSLLEIYSQFRWVGKAPRGVQGAILLVRPFGS